MRPEEADLLEAGRRMLVSRAEEQRAEGGWGIIKSHPVPAGLGFPLWCSTEEYGDKT